MTRNDIVKKLISEAALISRQKTESMDPGKSLPDNGINSMGFIELLLAVEREWQIRLIDKGITASDVHSLHALAERIERELPPDAP